MTRRPEKDATSIRRLVPGDASTYRALMLDAYERHPDAFTSTRAERESLPLSFWKARLAANDRASAVVLGDFERGSLIGVVGLSFESRDRLRHKATLFGMFVRPEFRGQGVGRRLVADALEVARSRAEVHLVQLTVSEDNRAARRLYESCGFMEFGTEPLAVAGNDGYITKVHMWRRVGSDPGVGTGRAVE